MLGLDTNVILRLLLDDDPVQKKRASKTIARAKAAGIPVMLGLGVVLELEWVLRSRARMNKAQVLAIFRLLLESYDVQIENEKVLEQAVHTYQHATVDFAECLFLAQYQRMGCQTMLTFDAKAARTDQVLDDVSLVAST